MNEKPLLINYVLPSKSFINLVSFLVFARLKQTTVLDFHKVFQLKARCFEIICGSSSVLYDLVKHGPFNANPYLEQLNISDYFGLKIHCSEENSDGVNFWNDWLPRVRIAFGYLKKINPNLVLKLMCVRKLSEYFKVGF